MEKEIITQKKLVVLANDAYLNAQRHGFYPDNTDITTALMLIITEMAEAVQADRHNRHGSIEDYESEIQIGRDIPTAYKNTLEGTVESEFADVCIRILSLLGWMDTKRPTEFQSDSYLKEEYGIAKIKYKCGIAKDFYHIISFLCSFTDNNSAYWYISKIIQKTLMQVFALAQNNNIDLMEHIKLKMQYNESRPYLHGCKY